MTITIGVVHGSRRQGHLANCLTSLSRQTVPVNVVLLYDDGTKRDPDCGRRAKLAIKSLQFHPVTYDASSGYCVAKVRNALFEHDADVRVWIDSDCVVAPDFAERLASLVMDDVPMAFALPRYDIQVGLDTSSATPNRPVEVVEALLWDGSRNAVSSALCGPGYAVTGNVDVRFDEDFRGWGGQDGDWGMRVMKAAKVVVGPEVYHQRHDPVPTQRDDWERNYYRMIRKHGFPQSAEILIGVTHGSDRADSLDRCLDSLFLQYTDVRVVVLYDAGTDRDPFVSERLALTHPGVLVHRVEYDATDGYNVSAVRNGIFKHLRDELAVGWIDSDCVATPFFGQEILSAVRDNPDAVLAFPRQRIIPGEGPNMTHLTIGGSWVAVPDTDLPKTPENTAAWLACGTDHSFCRAMGGVVACRADRAVCWDETYRGWGVEDQDWALQMRRAGAVGVQGSVVYHIEHLVAAHKQESDRRNRAIFCAKFGMHLCPGCHEYVTGEDGALCSRCDATAKRVKRGPEDALVGVVHGSDRVESLDSCLISLRRQQAKLRVVVLYDATSHRDDNVVARLAETHPDVEVVPVTYDRGAGYCVPAVRNALLPMLGKERLVGWLDSDASVQDDFVGAMLREMEATPNAVFACPRVRLKRDGRGKHSFPWSTSRFVQVAGYGIDRSDPDEVQSWLDEHDFACDVKALLGPAYFVAREYVQPFDEAYRNWGSEDDDWAASVLRAGAKAVLGPVVYHIEHDPEDAKLTRSHNRDILFAKWPMLEPPKTTCPKCGQTVYEFQMPDHVCEVQR